MRAELCEGEIYRNGPYSLASRPGDGRYKFYTADGCDSTVNVTLVYRRHVATELDVVICRGDAYVVFDTSYATAGTFVREGVSSQGCDSTVTLRPHPGRPQSDGPARDALLPARATGPLGRTFISNTSDSFRLRSRTGCDSLVVVDVRFRENNSSTEAATICAGESYAFAGNAYDASGTYSVRLTRSLRCCDSTVRLELLVLPEIRDTQRVTLCSGDTP